MSVAINADKMQRNAEAWMDQICQGTPLNAAPSFQENVVSYLSGAINETVWLPVKLDNRATLLDEARETAEAIRWMRTSHFCYSPITQNGSTFEISSTFSWIILRGDKQEDKTIWTEETSTGTQKYVCPANEESAAFIQYSNHETDNAQPLKLNAKVTHEIHAGPVQKAAQRWWNAMYQGNPKMAEEVFNPNVRVSVHGSLNGHPLPHTSYSGREKFMEQCQKVAGAIRYVISKQFQFELDHITRNLTITYKQELIIENAVEDERVWSKMNSIGIQVFTYRMNQGQAEFTKFAETSEIGDIKITPLTADELAAHAILIQAYKKSVGCVLL